MICCCNGIFRIVQVGSAIKIETDQKENRFTGYVG